MGWHERFHAIPARARPDLWETTQVAALKLPGLPFALEPEGGPPPGVKVLNGALQLTSAGGTDMFIDPGDSVNAPGRVPDAGRLTGLPPAGDFTLAAQVSVQFTSMYDAGVLLLWKDRVKCRMRIQQRWAGLKLRPRAGSNNELIMHHY